MKFGIEEEIVILIQCTVIPKVDREKSGPPVQFWQEKMDRGESTFFCQKWTFLAKSAPGPILSRKKWTGSSFTVKI